MRGGVALHAFRLSRPADLPSRFFNYNRAGVGIAGVSIGMETEGIAVSRILLRSSRASIFRGGMIRGRIGNVFVNFV